MTNPSTILLGVNVDHIATLREARGTDYPDPLEATQHAQRAGAYGVTVHLREDRRHIQDHDVQRIRQADLLPMNLEMAATAEMIEIALQTMPHECCLVPEKRAELTTEGGLDVVGQQATLIDYVAQLKSVGILVSLFIDADEEQIRASKAVGADIIELHTGGYADCDSAQIENELDRIQKGVELGDALGLQVNAGHGLHYHNVQAIAAIPQIVCLNIGHSIVAHAAMVGFHSAVHEMKELMQSARSGDK